MSALSTKRRYAHKSTLAFSSDRPETIDRNLFFIPYGQEQRWVGGREGRGNGMSYTATQFRDLQSKHRKSSPTDLRSDLLDTKRIRRAGQRFRSLEREPLLLYCFMGTPPRASRTFDSVESRPCKFFSRASFSQVTLVSTVYIRMRIYIYARLYIIYCL